MTNQPRSSSASAACERPAPDNPVMITNSLMVGSGLLAVEEEEAGDGGRRLVLCRTGEEAWWRGRLLHAAQHQSGGGERVDVRDRGRWMNGMKTPFSTSSIVSSSTR